ncbi:testis-expressed protein 52 [Discoglossus pictus]
MSCSSPPLSLLPDTPVHSYGFSTRGHDRLFLREPHYTEAKRELLGKLRKSPDLGLAPSATPGYLTWLKVSQLPPLLPLRPDKPYDSTVWRHLSSAPLNASPSHDPIPPPSRMAENNWAKYLQCRGARLDEKETQKLHMRTLCRVPPTDQQGNILPPKGFKRYPSWKSGAMSVPSISTHMESDLFCGTQRQRKPYMVTVQDNGPNLKEILQKYEELQGTARSIVPYNSRMPTPRAGAHNIKG